MEQRIYPEFTQCVIQFECMPFEIHNAECLLVLSDSLAKILPSRRLVEGGRPVHRGSSCMLEKPGGINDDLLGTPPCRAVPLHMSVKVFKCRLRGS
jgi:hypothetical protein